MGLFRRDNGYWYIAYTSGGKRRWVSTKERCYGRAVKFCRANATLWVRSRKASLTLLADAYSRYLAVDHARSTIEIVEGAFRNLVRLVGDMLVTTVTALDVDKFKAQRAQEVSAVRTNMEYRSLKTAFNKAAAWGMIEKNPFANVRQLRVPNRDPAFLTVEDFVKLWRVIDDAEFKVLVVVAVMAMLRRGELLHLAWDDIDFERHVIRVRNKPDFTVKGNRGRTVPMNELVARVLSTKPRIGEHVFCDAAGNRLNPNSVSRKFKVYIRRAGLQEDLHFHSLRHTGASWMAQQSVPLLQIQKILGHSSPSVTQIYSHLTDKNLIESVERIQIELPV